MTALAGLLLVDRIVLAGVFATAAAGKFADPEGSRRALAGFGLPSVLVGPGAIALPALELALGVGLLATPTAWPASLGALALLLLFLAAIVFSLAKGRAPDCHCFGQFHSEPIGPRTIAFNLALIAGAALLAVTGRADPGGSLVGWLTPLTPAERVAAAFATLTLAVLCTLGFLMWQMLLQQGRMLLRLETLESGMKGPAPPARPAYRPDEGAGLEIGTPAPDFALPDATGETQTLAGLLAPGEPLILLFTSPACGPCEALLPQIAGWRAGTTSPKIVMIAEGPAEHYSAALPANPDHPVLGRDGRQTAETYLVWGTPSAVLIDHDGVIASRAAGGADAIKGLMAWVREQRHDPAPYVVAPRTRPAQTEAPPGLPIGAGAPALTLNDLGGVAVDLSAPRERDTVLLFWNPGCGYCQQMLGDLQRWDSDPPPGAPDLLVVSSGSPDAGLAMNLRSAVLLDPQARAGAAFGAHGTPMAVLIDRKGKVASPVAAGGQAVLALAGA